MAGRLQGIISALVAVFLAASWPAAAAPSCKQQSNPQRIVAIGDLHGDGSAWSQVARAAGLIGGDGHWTGGKTVFVQTGDVVDRGPDSLAIIRELMSLQREAARAGGCVIALVGNHEAMNVTGDLRYVTAGEFGAFVDAQSERRREAVFTANKAAILAFFRKADPAMTEEAAKAAWFKQTPPGWIEHQAAWLPKGDIGRWVAANPAVVKVGDSLFVHGGISAAYAALPLAEINKRTAAALAKRDTAETAIINDPDGPLWYRGLITREPDPSGDAPNAAAAAATAAPRPSIDEEIDTVLRAYGVRRIVIGHTPSLTGIVVDRGGRLIRIDTGMSAYYRGPLAYLEIVGGKPVARSVARAAR